MSGFVCKEVSEALDGQSSFSGMCYPVLTAEHLSPLILFRKGSSIVAKKNRGHLLPSHVHFAHIWTLGHHIQLLASIFRPHKQ